METDLWFGTGPQRELIRKLAAEKLTDTTLPERERQELQDLLEAAADSVPVAGVGPLLFPSLPLYVWHESAVNEFEYQLGEQVQKIQDHSEGWEGAATVQKWLNALLETEFGDLTGICGLGVRTALRRLYLGLRTPESRQAYLRRNLRVELLSSLTPYSPKQ